MFFIQIWSHIEKSAIYLEIENEVFQVLLIYHMFLFTPFVITAEMRHNYGTSFTVVVSMIMCTNIAYAAYGSVVDARRRKKLGNLKAAYEVRVADAKDAKIKKEKEDRKQEYETQKKGILLENKLRKQLNMQYL